MNELDESMEHQATNLIHEFQRIDDLLNDYGNKFSKLTVEISELETELIIWKNEREELSKSTSNKEEVKIWNEQINKIESNKKSKKSELDKFQKKLDDLTLQKESLKDILKTTELDHTEYVINLFQKYFKYSEENIEFHKQRDAVIASLNLLKTFWEILDINSDLTTFIKFFKSNEIKIDLQILNILFNESKSHIFPSIIPDFMDEYLKDLNLTNLVDSNCNIGSLLFNLNTDEESELICLLEDGNDEDVIRLLYPDKSTKLSSFNTLQELPDYKFDVVMGSSDLHQSEQSALDSEFDEMESNIRFLQTSRKLKEGGVAFFILNQDIRLRWDDSSVSTKLKKYELHIDSVIRLATEIFPERDSNKTLLIIKRKKPKKIFVGELNNNSKEILLENLKKRKEGKIPQHGTLIDLKSFYSFPNFLALEGTKYLGRSTGLTPLKFKDIAKEVRSFDKFSESKDDFNYIFLPCDYNTEVVLSSQSFKSEPEKYLQIFLEPEVALSDYVARFYDTQLGKKIRESVNADYTIPQISKKLLLESDIYLPDIDTQIELVRIDSSITELTTRAQSYKVKLWNSPLEVTQIQKEIEDMDDGKSEERFEQWIETLPYPLASILWCSITNPQFERKVKYLLHFFEAFSEFNMVLLLSGLSSDRKFFQSEVKRCFKDDPKFRNWYYHPTFGNWYKFGSCLSKTIRRLLEENKAKCLELFDNPDPEFLLRIADKDLVTVFEEVARYRNQWEGHGPVVSEKEYQNRYKILRSILSKVYEIISDGYEHSFLILPLQSSFQDGVHNYSIRRYMSTRAPFKPDNIETVKIMDKTKIYLAHVNQRKPLELLPLILNLGEACYFYNGKDYDTGESRYVSYHYNKKPEIFLPMDKLNPVISLFKPLDDFNV